MIFFLGVHVQMVHLSLRYTLSLAFVVVLFSQSSHVRDLNIGTVVSTLPGACLYIESALGLVGPVSVYYDWVRYKV